MELNTNELLSVVGIYIVVVLVAAVAAWKSHRRLTANGNDLILGNRSFGAFIGIVTMTATWVSGTYLIGTAQTVHDKGFIWSQQTFGYPVSIAIGGLLFARKMREDGYVTVMDPFQEKFGECLGGILSLLSIAGEIFWSASILASLGNVSEVLIGLNGTISVLACASAVIIYTTLGGIYSVSFTHVLLLVFIFCGMWISLPFVLAHPKVHRLNLRGIFWIGDLKTYDICYYVDSLLLYIFGAVPWQSFHQRILTIRNPRHARLVSNTSAFLCLVIVAPAVMMGIIAKALDENDSTILLSSNKSELSLAKVIKYTTPTSVSFLGFCAISSAVMSSASAALLSASSLISRNIYKRILRKKATMLEISLIMRITIAVIGAGATAMAILVPYVNSLWYTFAVLLYVIIMPQLLCLIYFTEYVNTCGSLMSCIVGMIMIVLSGDVNLRIPAFIRYPFFDLDRNLQLFPFKTISMLTSLITLLLVSEFSKWILKKEMPPQCCLQLCGGGDKKLDLSVENAAADLELGEINAEGMNGQAAVEIINPALTANGEMFELQDKKLAKMNLIKSEIFYGSNGESTDV